MTKEDPKELADNARKDDVGVLPEERLCEQKEGCGALIHFGLGGPFCTDCRRQIVSSVDFTCLQPDCQRRPLYGFVENEPKYCSMHKSNSMQDVVNLRCQQLNCKRPPYYGLPGQSPRYCNSHKESGMVDLVNRPCTFLGCSRRAIFGLSGEKPIWCSNHKVPGTVDTSYRRCEALGCYKWPLYAYEGERARFCSMHKEEGMNDVRSRRCRQEGCMHQPSYGIEGFSAQYCSAHKEPGMVDVVSKRCKQVNCRRRPLYGFAGYKAQYCSTHKIEGMVDVMNRRCKVRGCKQRPTGKSGRFFRLCSEHAIESSPTGQEIAIDSLLPLQQPIILRPSYTAGEDNFQHRTVSRGIVPYSATQSAIVEMPIYQQCFNRSLNKQQHFESTPQSSSISSHNSARPILYQHFPLLRDPVVKGEDPVIDMRSEGDGSDSDELVSTSNSESYQSTSFETGIKRTGGSIKSDESLGRHKRVPLQETFLQPLEPGEIKRQRMPPWQETYMTSKSMVYHTPMEPIFLPSYISTTAHIPDSSLYAHRYPIKSEYCSLPVRSKNTESSRPEVMPSLGQIFGPSVMSSLVGIQWPIPANYQPPYPLAPPRYPFYPSLYLSPHRTGTNLDIPGELIQQVETRCYNRQLSPPVYTSNPMEYRDDIEESQPDTE